MRAMVVYESIFGNTHAVANAIADGLRSACDVSLHPVEEAAIDAASGVELFVIGGPTHMHGLSSQRSRAMGTEQAEKHGVDVDEGAEGTGLRAWLDELGQSDGAKAAAFDTRLRGRPLVTGSAARGIARRLRRHGFHLVADPESFLVSEAEGPLVDGEIDRARAWGRSLVAARAEDPHRR